MKSLRMLSASLCLAGLAACAPQQAVVTSDPGIASAELAAMRAEPEAAAELARDFELVAFRQSGLGTTRATSLNRIQPPLSMTVNPEPGRSSEATRRQVGIVEAAVAALESGAGVRFVDGRMNSSGSPNISAEQPGFFVMFANRATISEIIGNADASLKGAILGAGCGSLSLKGQDGTRWGAIILVDASRPTKDQSYCVHREMIGNMGLGGFLRRTDSVFSNSAIVPNFSARDLMLVRMLYDPRLRNGMTLAQAKPKLLEIAKDVLAR